MIKALQVSTPQVAPGWYWDDFLGWCYHDGHGNILHEVTNRFTGQTFQALGFVTTRVHPATDINSGAPIPMPEGATVRVNYSFEHRGTAGSVVLQVGNCAQVGPYTFDRAGQTEKTITLYEGTSWRTYSGYLDFIFSEGGAPGSAPHLFVLLHGEDYEVVYTDAFTWMEAEFQQLEITDYIKA